MKKYLSWDDLADIYDKKTGGKARTLPMQSIADWASNQKDILTANDGRFYIIEGEN